MTRFGTLSSIETEERHFSIMTSRIGPVILASIAGLLISATVVPWAVDGVSGGACTITSSGCTAARLTGVGLAAALLFGVVLLTAVLPRRAAALWSLLVAASAGGALLGALLGRAGAGGVPLGCLLACLVGLSVWDVSTRLRLPALRGTAVAVLKNPAWLLLLAALVLGTIVYLQQSHRILSWDPLNYWEKTDKVAAAIQRGLRWGDVVQWLRTASDDYSMFPAFLPGLLTSGAAQDDIVAYLVAVAVCYVFPTYIAVGCLGLVLAGAPWGPRRHSPVSLAVLGAVAAFASVPVFIYAFLGRGYLDIGGVPIVILLAGALAYSIGLIAGAEGSALRGPRALRLVAAGVAVALLAILA